MKPKHSVSDVAKRLANGLLNGSIVLKTELCDENDREIYCHGCGATILASEAHWHSGEGYCDGCENAPAESPDDSLR